MATLAIAEVLEPRRLFSVSAVTLAGPLTPGDTWQYDGGLEGTGETVTIDAGSDNPKVRGNNLLTIASYQQDGNDLPLDDDIEVALSRRTGLIAYGLDSDGGGWYVRPEFFCRNSPPQVLFPPVMTAGQIYRSTFSQVDVSAGYVRLGIEQNSPMLVSDQLQSITVPAGTFGCYEVVNSSQSTTQWISPGVGLVQAIDYLGDTNQLASYTVAANPGQTRIMPDVLSTTLPTTVVAGSTVNATARVELTNTNTAASATEVVTTDLYATTDQATESNAILLGSVQQQTTLNAGGSEVVSIPINRIPLIAARLAGGYTLFARTTDAFGQIFDAGSSFTTHIAPGVVNLQTLITEAVAPHGTAGSALITVTITNTGEIRSQKSAAIELFSSDDVNQSPAGIVAPTILRIQRLPLNLAPGQVRTYRLRLTRSMLKRADQNTCLWADLLSKQDGPSALIGVPLPLSS